MKNFSTFDIYVAVYLLKLIIIILVNEIFINCHIFIIQIG